jgi:lactate dehydrogenase-like 2-hydroxyacid dehydrogenase
MAKILVTGSSVRADLLRPLEEAGFTVDNPKHLLSEDELKTALADCDGYLLGGDEIATRAALSSAKRLKIIAFLGMGYESFVDAVAAKELGIAVTNTPGTLNNAVAECTVGLVLCCTRRLFLYASQYALGQSGNEEKQRDLSALHVGIVGLGGVGTRIAEILRHGFGSRVSYFSRTRKPSEEKRLGVSYASLDQLCREVEILVVMTSWNPGTKGLIDYSLVSSAKKGLMLVNTARPEIVEPEALMKGLQDGQIGYAAFDSFYEQPGDVVTRLKTLIPSRLMVTPHIGSLTNEARDAMAKKATQSLINVLKTGKDTNIVNR